MDADGNIYAFTNYDFADRGLHVASLAPSGALRWNITLPDSGECDFMGAIAAPNNTLLIGNHVDGLFIALETSTGKIRWKTRTPGVWSGSGTWSPHDLDVVYADNTGPDKAKGPHKILQALDMATGAERWGVTFLALTA